jgi:hypothetical protein
VEQNWTKTLLPAAMHIIFKKYYLFKNTHIFFKSHDASERTEGTGLEQAERNWPRVGFPCWTWVGEPTLDMDLLNAVSTTVKESHCKRHPILIPFEKK